MDYFRFETACEFSTEKYYHNNPFGGHHFGIV